MNGLMVHFELSRSDSIFGESVPFVATVSHTFKTPLSVNALDPANRALTVFMRRIDGDERSADQMTPLVRDNIQVEIPRVPEGLSLEPGKKLELKDDLLRWFGHIPAGTYKVWAEYRGIMRHAASEPVDLRVSQAAILAANTPRWGLQASDAPYAATWAHRHEKGIMLFYQLMSPHVPRNPVRSIRTVIVNEQVSAHAACLPGADCPVGHLYWFTAKERFFFVPIDVKNARPGPPVEVRKLPFKGWPAAPALSCRDGSFLVPFTDYKKTRFALLHVDPSGEVQPCELDLGRNAPMGPFVCLFEHDARLHIVWTKAKGRQIDYAMLPLDDLESGFATRTVQISNDPILWFDAYLDRSLTILELQRLYLGEEGAPGNPPDEEPPPTKVMAWCVSSRPGRMVCTPVSMTDSAVQQPVSFSLPRGSNMSVLGSVTTSERGLALLLADGQDRTFYASTMRRTCQPLEEIVGIPIASAQFPSLMRGSSYPWVHLRFVMGARMINYIRLEPEDEPDPVECETKPWDIEEEEEVEAPEELDEPEEEGGDEG